MREEVLILKNISHTYSNSGVQANKRVNMTLLQGEIHGLAGENGSGKSTLMKIAAGELQPDAGEILLRGESRSFSSPAEAVSGGIGMVYQAPRMIAPWRVWENILLNTTGNHGAAKRFFDAFTLHRYSRAEQLITPLLDKFNIPLDIKKETWKLSAFEQRLAAITSLILEGCRILLLDEATLGLTDHEKEKFFNLITMMSHNGFSFVLITHKLGEIRQYCNRVTILRNGESTGTTPTAEVTPAGMAALMTGTSDKTASDKPESHTRTEYADQQNQRDRRTPLFRMRNVSLVKGGEPILQKIDVTARSGQITAVVGMQESGLKHLELLLAGIIEPTGGDVLLKDRPLTHKLRRKARKECFSYIPSDRLIRGANLHTTLGENLILLQYPRFQNGGFFKRNEIVQFTKRLKQHFSIEGGVHHPMHTLSGGNIQKAIMARELSTNPQVIIFAEPSWGLDFRSKSDIYSMIRDMKQQGTAVILLSSDPDEVLDLADTAGVLYDGSIRTWLSEDMLTRKNLGLAMTGAADGKETAKGEIQNP